jgi:FkbM family methyltransferase
MPSLTRSFYDFLWKIKNALLPNYSFQQTAFISRFLKRFLSMNIPECTKDANGHILYLDLIDSLNLSQKKVHEPLETNFLKFFIRQGMQVLDIGANIGYFTLLFAKLVGRSGRVYAFEPDPTNFSLLTKNVAANEYTEIVDLHEIALYNDTSTLPLYLCETNCGDHRVYDPGRKCNCVVIQAMPLDAVLPCDHRIDFIKMDIQGCEYYALQGMKRLLASNPTVTIFLEFWPKGLHLAGSSTSQLFNLLLSNGFFPFELDPSCPGYLKPTSQAELDRLYTVSNNLFGNLFFKRHSETPTP